MSDGRCAVVAAGGGGVRLLALVLSLAAWAVFPAAVCGGWVSQSRDRKKKPWCGWGWRSCCC